MDVWKSTAICLAGVLVTGVATWITFGSGHPTRSEVERMISERSPYIRERDYLQRSISDIRADNSKVNGELRLLSTEQTKTGAKLDQILVDIASLRNESRELREALKHKGNEQ